MSTGGLDFRNVNTLWGSVMAETLSRRGVRQAVVSPGSRSTPLTMALARHPGIEALPVLDERSAAFFALGLAKQSGAPVALVCTSGTAGANYFPAVIEAQESGAPLLVLTADRPPELRACASGQTIDQQKLFGGHVNFYHELALPDAGTATLSCLRQTVAHACARTLCPQAGPVHLNVPFRDPLAPVADGRMEGAEAAFPPEFFSHLSPVTLPAVGRIEHWAEPLDEQGLIVAGPDPVRDVAAYVKAVAQLAIRLGWPVLADGVSPLRHHAMPGVTVVTRYDTILRHKASAGVLRPKRVLALGTWPTSKVLRQWLAEAAPEIVLLTERGDNRDALHGRTRQIAGRVEEMRVVPARAPAGDYTAAWRKAEARVEAALLAQSRPAGGLFEGDVVRALAGSLPPGTPVFVASSMPVRDVEYFWPYNDRGCRFFANRGANGIDGTLSTAFGVVHDNRPAVLLTGDLAFLHDSNGLMLSRRLRGSLTVVLINNRGGGIFEHLPVAQFEPPFEEYFATPQAVDFAKLCAAHGAEHELVADLARLRALTGSLPAAGVRVLELRTDRKHDAAARQAMFAAAAAAALG